MKDFEDKTDIGDPMVQKELEEARERESLKNDSLHGQIMQENLKGMDEGYLTHVAYIRRDIDDSISIIDQNEVILSEFFNCDTRLIHWHLIGILEKKKKGKRVLPTFFKKFGCIKLTVVLNHISLYEIAKAFSDDSRCIVHCDQNLYIVEKGTVYTMNHNLLGGKDNTYLDLTEYYAKDIYVEEQVLISKLGLFSVPL